VILVEAGPELFSMFKPKLREYTRRRSTTHGRGQDRRDGLLGLPDPRDAQGRRGAEGAHARLGRRACRERARADARLELQRGNRIGVGPDLDAPRAPEVYALGDVAAIVDAKTEQVLPQLGSVALQSGEHAARQIARRIAGKETKPFKYKDKGTMARSAGGPRSCRCSAGRR
jgi:NADH dehydrogenase